MVYLIKMEAEMVKEYQICTRCIMDTTDPNIVFDEYGVCNHCREFDEVKSKNWFPNEDGKIKLKEIVDKIKASGKGKEYDCIIGLSGGVDSSYLVHKAVELGLRPLAVHVDAGWNSELAVKNIENICKKLNVDLFTEVINWEEIRDLQVAFLKAGVPNQDIPQDHAFFAGLYSFAVKNNIEYVLSGSNYATEGILPSSWGYNAMDSKHLKAIHKMFGNKKLKTYPVVSFYQYYYYYPILKKMKVAKLLNYMPYSKDDAIETLEKELDWRYYGGKHFESRFTKFFQAYYLPTRFNYDKRKAHLSSLIVSGLITRERALQEMEKELYSESQLREDKEFIAKKLKLSVQELDDLINMPLKYHEMYPSNEKLYRFVKGIYSTVKPLVKK